MNYIYREPFVEHRVVPAAMRGPYIQLSPNETISFTTKCPGHEGIYVTCPAPTCGMRLIGPPASFRMVRKSNN